MLNGTEQGSVDLTIPEEDYICIPIETDEAEIKRARAIYEKQKFNRAKANREFRKRIQEDLEEKEW